MTRTSGNNQNNEGVKPSKVRLAIKVLTACLSVLITLYLILLVVVQVFLPHKAVDILGYRFYLISQTGSMKPLFEYNDLIIVTKFDFDKLQEGDIITFLSQLIGSNELIHITHRIEKIVIDNDTGKKLLQTKGINLPGPDTVFVAYDGLNGTNKYVGKYATKIPFIGKIFVFCKSKQGLIAIAVNTVCIIAIYLIITKKGMK